MSTDWNEDDWLEQEGDYDTRDPSSFEDRLGAIGKKVDGNDLVLTRTQLYGSRQSYEVIRFDRSQSLLCLTPRVIRHGDLEDQFDRITELQIESRTWDSAHHSAEQTRYGLLYARGLPKGFRTVYEYGLGIKRQYDGLIDEIEKQAACTIVRFVRSGPEGLSSDGARFDITLARFNEYRMLVDRNHARGRAAVNRVLAAETHNSVVDLFNGTKVEPAFGRHPISRALTEEVATGHVLNELDLNTLVSAVSVVAPRVARESPAQLDRLREGLELVSLKTLIERFEADLSAGHVNDEAFWQEFFTANHFALQQVFSTPIVVEKPHAHVQAEDIDGSGARITDFLCANTVTRTAVVVEIKTPASSLMSAAPYRGKDGAGVHAPHIDLSGAIAQVQSQMSAVPRDLAQRMKRTRSLDLDPWNDIRGAVISGRVSKLSDAQRESFLRFRAGLGNVTVLGYDEVLDRLRGLHSSLSQP